MKSTHTFTSVYFVCCLNVLAQYMCAVISLYMIVGCNYIYIHMIYILTSGYTFFFITQLLYACTIHDLCVDICIRLLGVGHTSKWSSNHSQTVLLTYVHTHKGAHACTPTKEEDTSLLVSQPRPLHVGPC